MVKRKEPLCYKIIAVTLVLAVSCLPSTLYFHNDIPNKRESDKGLQWTGRLFNKGDAVALIRQQLQLVFNNAQRLRVTEKGAGQKTDDCD